MKKILLLFLIVFPSLGYSQHLFINTTPLKAKVYLLEPKNKESVEDIDPETQESGKKSKFKRKLLGTTPLRIEMPSNTILIEVHKEGFEPVQNKIKPATKSFNVKHVLSPITFAVQFPNIDSNLYIDKKTLDSSMGTVLFPYGNYNITFNRKNMAMDINYRSPYIPYVAFFSTLTALSIAAIVTGALLGDQAFQKYQQGSTPSEVTDAIAETTAWDSVMWTGVGLGSAGLIGMAVSGHYEAQERKRIKRIHELNRSPDILSPLEDYQEILIAGSANPTKALRLMASFIKNHDDNPLIIDVLQRRAIMFTQQGNNSRAIEVWKTLRDTYPSMDAYETAGKNLGDLYMARQDYENAYKAFADALDVATIYPQSLLRYYMLENLFLLACENNKFLDTFLELSEDTSGLTADQIAAINNHKQVIQSKKASL